MSTRPEFLASGALAGVGLASAAAARYVGVRRDNRVSIFTMDAHSRKVAWQQQVRVEGGPDPIALAL